MIAEAGLAALWLAAAMAILQVLGGALALAGKGNVLAEITRPVALA
jgi:cytochrome c-type biogenesis protein CcmF